MTDRSSRHKPTNTDAMLGRVFYLFFSFVSIKVDFVFCLYNCRVFAINTAAMLFIYPRKLLYSRLPELGLS